MDQGDGKVPSGTISFSIDSDDEGMTIMDEICMPTGHEEPLKQERHCAQSFLRRKHPKGK
jgi:hypothetical protein